jgi:hypothetical protein
MLRFLPHNTRCFFLRLLTLSSKAMARCSPLGEAAATALEVKNIDKPTVVAELERAFGENPAVFGGESRRGSPDAKDALIEGGSDGEKLRTYYFGSSTITIGKIKEMVEKVTSWRAKPKLQGLKLCQSPTATKPWYMRTFLSLACPYLCIWPWLTFFCTSKRNCIN